MVKKVEKTVNVNCERPLMVSSPSLKVRNIFVMIQIILQFENIRIVVEFL